MYGAPTQFNGIFQINQDPYLVLEKVIEWCHIFGQGVH